MLAQHEYWDYSRSEEVIDFFEHCVRLTKSPFYGLPFKLQLWQKAFIEAVYAAMMPDMKHSRFQRILLLIGRKNGKSETASGLLLRELFMGGQGKDLVASSNDDNQSDILYQATDTMRLQIDPDQRDSHKGQKSITVPEYHNQLFKLSETTRNKEGRNIDFAVIDEVHEMKDNSIVKPIEQSMSIKENPKLIMITTEGFENDGFLDNELKRARGILSGEICDNASYKYLPWLYTQDSESEVWDGNHENRLWMKSNPSLGAIKKWSYLEDQVDLAKTSQAERAFVLSKDFNIKQSTATAWLKYEDIAALDGPVDLKDFEGMKAIGGVDIAETTDLECARIAFFRDGKVYTHSHYWIPSIKLKLSNDKSCGAKYEEWAKQGILTIEEGNYLNPAHVADWFFDLYKKHRIRTIWTGYDIRFATAFLERMKKIGLQTEMVYQSPEVLHNSICIVETDIETKRVIGFNDMDRWCCSNCSLQVNKEGKGLLVKIRGEKGRKIDGAVTLAIMYETYLRHRGDIE